MFHSLAPPCFSLYLLLPTFFLALFLSFLIILPFSLSLSCAQPPLFFFSHLLFPSPLSPCSLLLKLSTFLPKTQDHRHFQDKIQIYEMFRNLGFLLLSLFQRAEALQNKPVTYREHWQAHKVFLGPCVASSATKAQTAWV